MMPMSYVVAQSPGGRGVQIAQESGAAIGDNFGQDCALLGDLNGDGFSEWLVGAPLVFNSQVGRTGAAFVFSGADGTVLYEYHSTTLNDNFGTVVEGFGDLDRDGVNDFAITGLLSGTVHVYSGASGVEMFTVVGDPVERFGWSLASAGDLNHDGHDDFLVGAYFANTGFEKEGAVYAYSGADGTELLRIEGQVPYAQLGFAIDGGEDIDGDGVPDFLISSFLEDDGMRFDVGAIRIYSGVHGGELLSIAGVEADAGMGESVSFLSDLNRDGIPEVLSGTSNTCPNTLEAGSAFVHCGATGDLIHRIDGFEFEQGFGKTCASIGDLTGDGFPDFAIGSLRASNPDGVEDVGRVDIYSGRDARLVHSIYGENPFDGLSRGLDGGHDVNGDGKPDIIASAPQDFLFLSQEGTAVVYGYDSFIEIDQAELSVSQGGTTTVQLKFPPSEANKGYALLASLRGDGVTTLDGLAIPLKRDRLFSLMVVGQAPSQFQNTLGQLDSAAQATPHIALPANSPAELIGRRVSLTAVSFGSAQLRKSSGSVYIELLP